MIGRKGNVIFGLFLIIMFVAFMFAYTTYTRVYASAFPKIKTLINNTGSQLEESNRVIRGIETSWAVLPYLLVFFLIMGYFAATQKREQQVYMR